MADDKTHELFDKLRATLAGEEALLLRAADLDARRQEQIGRQSDIITRLLGGEDHADVLLRTTAELSDKTWQIAGLKVMFTGLVLLLRNAKGGAADVFHVEEIREALEMMRAQLEIETPLEEINPPAPPNRMYKMGDKG
jgi:hypothetical protein